MTYDDAVIMSERLRECMQKGTLLDYKDDVAMLYLSVLGKTIRNCNCRDKYSDAFIEVYNYLKRNGKMKEKSDARLLAGVVIHDLANNKIYTNENLTDEVAADYLKRFPNAKSLFEVLPPAKAKKNTKTGRTKE